MKGITAMRETLWRRRIAAMRKMLWRRLAAMRGSLVKSISFVIASRACGRLYILEYYSKYRTGNERV